LSASAADVACKQYLATVAGKLRDPLRTILHLALLIRDNDGTLDGRIQQYAEYIRSSADQMYEVVEGLHYPGEAAAGRSCSPEEPGAPPRPARTGPFNR
jgi:hypothetical protein